MCEELRHKTHLQRKKLYLTVGAAIIGITGAIVIISTVLLGKKAADPGNVIASCL